MRAEGCCLKSFDFMAGKSSCGGGRSPSGSSAKGSSEVRSVRRASFFACVKRHDPEALHASRIDARIQKSPARAPAAHGMRGGVGRIEFLRVNGSGVFPNALLT
jgi:hypothetical protein